MILSDLPQPSKRSRMLLGRHKLAARREARLRRGLLDQLVN
jgi:hypothetical protein